MSRFLKQLGKYDDSMTVREIIEMERQKEIPIKGGFFADNVFYENGTIEQLELLDLPITEEEQGTLLGYYKQLWQEKTQIK